MPKTHKGVPLRSVDAKRDLTFWTSLADIKQGVRKDGENCALSRAIRRQYGALYVQFMKTVAFVQFPGDDFLTRYDFSKIVRDRIIFFDVYKRMEPFEVVLHAPRRSHTTEYLRSPERRKRANASAKKRKDQPKREYKISTILKLRVPLPLPKRIKK